MDDDPEPNLDPVILTSREMSEHVLNIGELQKCSLENNDENGFHQESGDNGPFLEPEATKKPVPPKDASDPTLQLDKKTGIFRSKERIDLNQPPDVSGNLKSNTTSLRKPSRRNIQYLPGQESRRSSQQPTVSQTSVSQKSSPTQLINEPDTKEITWVSQRTGKIMKCRSQQTSLIWERKALSDILHPSSEDSDRSKSEETDEITSSGEMASTEEASGPEARRIRYQREEKRSKRNSLQLESRRSSQRSTTEPFLLMQKGTGAEEELSWVSQRTGKEMKNKAQQTSIIWELKTLSEILRHSSQESLCNLETDTTEGEDPFVSSAETDREQPKSQKVHHSIQQTQTKPVRGLESRRGSQRLEAKPSRPEIQQPEPAKPEPAKIQEQKFDQAQQTDSSESLRRELLDYSQQMDGSETNLIVEEQGSCHGIQQIDVPRSRHGSQELKRQDSELRNLDVQKRSQESLGPEAKVGPEEEPKLPTALESEQTKLISEPVLAKELQKRRGSVSVEDGTWVSRKTGKVVKNQSQQTDKSWLQYCAAKMQKIKKCRSQQTDESFLQRYSNMKISSQESLASRAPPADFGSVHEETSELHFIDVQLCPMGSHSDTSMTQMAVEMEPPTGRDEERTEQQGAEDEKMADKSTSEEVQWPGEPEIKSTTDSETSFMEGEDKAQQTYSVISVEGGIWMNRRTGKLLVSHVQQTSLTAIPLSPSVTVLRNVGSVEGKAFRPPGRADVGGQDENKEAHPEAERYGQEPSRKASCHSNEDQDAHLIIVQPVGEGSQCADDVEKLLSRRLSEAMLLSIESPDGEDETSPLYTAVEEGSWMNMKTGSLLKSQKQQTEESADELLVEEERQSRVALQQSPEEGQVAHPGLNSDFKKEPGEEGMDDDPEDKF